MGRRRRSESSSSSSSEDSEARRLRKERKRLKKERKKMKKEAKKRRRRSKSPTAAKPVEGPKPPPPPARPSLLAAAMAPLSTGTVAGDRSGSFVGSGWSHGGSTKKEGPLTGLQRAHREESRETALHALARKKPET